MQVQFLKATEFRGKKYKKGAKSTLPEGVSFKLIASGLAVKA